MKNIALKTKEYLENMLDVKVEIRHSNIGYKLPHFFSEKYIFYDLTLNGKHYLLIEGKDMLTAKVVKLHSHILENRFGIKVIYLSKSINPSLRRAFIKERISFIIPDNQIYLPHLGILFNESCHQEVKKRNRFSSLTQVVIIRTLLEKEYQLSTVSMYAKKYYLNVMYVSRAFRELTEYELITRDECGKEKPIHWLFTGKELWEKAQPYFFNPINKVIWFRLNRQVPFCLAGFSALSKYSMLTPENYESYATTRIIAKKFPDLVEIPYKEEQTNELQLWRYNPKLITSEDYVDPLSLFLCFKEEPDERVQMALEEMMEKIKW